MSEHQDQDRTGPSGILSRRGILIVSGLALLSVLYALLWAPTDSYRLTPGPTFDLTEQNSLPGSYDLSNTDGQWVALTATADPINHAHSLWLQATDEELLYQAASGAVDGADRQVVAARQVSLNVAMDHLDEDGNGLYVVAESAGELQPGMRILTIDGQPPQAGEQPAGEWTVIDSRGSVQSIEVPEPVEVSSIEPRTLPDADTPLPTPGPDAINVDTFPLEDVGGSSAALVQTLAWIDAFTDEDLTGGQSIAVTGSLTSDGQVQPVAGVVVKLQAAQERGADLVLIPEGYNGPLPEGLNVVEVATVHEALNAVEDAT